MMKEGNNREGITLGLKILIAFGLCCMASAIIYAITKLLAL